MRVADGHKGKAGYACTVTGLASHSALNHLGVNAIEIAAEIIVRLRRRNLEFRTAGPFQARLRSAALHGHRQRRARRHRAEHRARRVPLRVRVPDAAGPGPGSAACTRCRPSPRLSCCPRCAPAIRMPRSRGQELMSYPALGGAGNSAIEELCHGARGRRAARQGRVRHRGRPVRRARHRERGLRPGRHDGRAQAGRIRRAGRARALRRVSPAIGRSVGGGLSDERTPDRGRGAGHRRLPAGQYRDPLRHDLREPPGGTPCRDHGAGPRQRALRRLGRWSSCSRAASGHDAAGCRSRSSTLLPTHASIPPSPRPAATSTRTSTGSGMPRPWTGRGARSSSTGRAPCGR